MVTASSNCTAEPKRSAIRPAAAPALCSSPCVLCFGFVERADLGVPLLIAGALQPRVGNRLGPLLKRPQVVSGGLLDGGKPIGGFFGLALLCLVVDGPRGFMLLLRVAGQLAHRCGLAGGRHFQLHRRQVALGSAQGDEHDARGMHLDGAFQHGMDDLHQCSLDGSGVLQQRHGEQPDALLVLFAKAFAGDEALGQQGAYGMVVKATGLAALGGRAAADAAAHDVITNWVWHGKSPPREKYGANKVLVMRTLAVKSSNYWS